jgi:hypothetical protein
MTQDIIAQIISSLPNFLALVLMLFWQQSRITQVLAHSEEMDKRLLSLLEGCIGDLAGESPAKRATGHVGALKQPSGE